MTRIAIGLTEGFADWECALLMAVARSYLGIEVKTASPDGAPVTSMGGLKALPDLAFGAIDAETFDALVLAGGTIWDTDQAPDVSTLVTAYRARERVIAAICGATLALARAGVLNDVRHTSNAADFLTQAENYKGAALYRESAHSIRDGRIVTAAGTSPHTFAAEVLKALGHWSPESDYYLGLFGNEHRA
ncbi:glutamine amidotransferase [Rhizobiaceae bacterium n13]|uniref:Glutamine amidotransferase n=1 Tax=Ferirhizobium litorale TaxID=2927786 RepID=A0AAE3QDX7_9HYPH|nr:type 1 glutamine amidotransferase family protein [Fererhizobium litorale]MDI7861322.1 glutamine amidotransferase [Fererhizobium litorale]MDI7921469.1 glutamine amidotransferase [Fererhizobium litorale]